MESIRIYEIPACKMVSSGVGMFGDDNFDRFDAWLASAKGLPTALGYEQMDYFVPVRAVRNLQ